MVESIKIRRIPLSPFRIHVKTLAPHQQNTFQLLDELYENGQLNY